MVIEIIHATSTIIQVLFLDFKGQNYTNNQNYKLLLGTKDLAMCEGSIQIADQPSWRHQNAHWEKKKKQASVIPDCQINSRSSLTEMCVVTLEIKLALTRQITSTQQDGYAVGKTRCPFPYQSNNDLFLLLIYYIDLKVMMFNMCNCICLLEDGLTENILMINTFSPICRYQMMWQLSTLQKKHKMMPAQNSM